jgi:hypothetical protein
MSIYRFSLILIISFSSLLISQTPDKEYFKKHSEVYFQFEITGRAELETLTRIISIDNVIGNTIKAYANEDEWTKFLELKYKYTILPHPGDGEGIIMSDDLRSFGLWDVYPTYETYVQMMSQFAANYPGICRIVDAGNTINGRKILFAVISDNVNVKEAEPQFMYSSTMHGDETTGYVLMLRLIDSLLTSYGTDPRITHMIDNAEIWINPNANPDGTYYTGNHTVSGARRYNANSIDLNRNFPTPAGSPSGSRQVETQNMMNIAEANNFVLSANFHGGAEVVNYPWDAFQRLHADNTWFYQISRKYADTAQANSPYGYMDDLNNGVTNGYAWYPVYGGRQDYFTYFRRGREVTIEISSTKNPSSSLLPNFWNYNRHALLSFIENSLYGVRGIVSDSAGNPLKARVSIAGHDADSSEIYSDYRTGNYHRLLAPGTYSLTFTAENHLPETVTGVQVNLHNTTVLNIQLVSSAVPVELVSFNAFVNGNSVELKWQTATETNNYGFEIQRRKEADNNWEILGFINGNATTSEINYYSYTDKPAENNKYYYRLKQIDFDGSFSYSSVLEAEINIIDFALYQNYPNPFNPSTVIKYSVGEDSFVKLSVIDILGREIIQLVNSRQTSGTYQVTLNAFGLSSGIYLLRLSAVTDNGMRNEFTRKINLVK